VDKQRPYVGEAILYRLEVGVPTTLRRRGHPQVQVSGWDALTNEPGLEGHWTDRQKSVDGQRYRIDEVAVPLFSSEPGVVKLEPSQVAVEIVQRGRRIVGLESNPLELTVRPLPTRGKPDDFEDVVGRFRMESELDKAELSTGGSAVLTVRVEGFGSLRGARPRIELPEGLRAYDETPEVRAWATDTGLRTEALFRTAVVPLEPGSYTLPPFELDVLDPTDGSYKLVRSQPIELLVTGDPVTDSAVSARSATLTADRSEVEFLGGIRPLHDDGLVGDARLGIGSPLVLCLLLLPLLGFTGLASRATRERMAGTDTGRLRRRRKAARDSLRATRAAARSNDLSAGEAALRGYLTARLDRSGAALSPLESSAVLAAAGAPQELADRLGALLASLEEARYGGADTAGLAARLGAWIEQADKEWQ